MYLQAYFKNLKDIKSQLIKGNALRTHILATISSLPGMSLEEIFLRLTTSEDAMQNEQKVGIGDASSNE